jgi:outer membrane protein assembly factor BamA
MSARAIRILTTVFCVLPATFVSAQTPAEVIAEVRVQGNLAATDDEVVKLAGIEIGAPLTSTSVQQITERLRDSHKFEKVEVLKRFASIEDPSRIVIVIIVDEGPVSIGLPKMPGGRPTVTPRGPLAHLMFLPILSSEDGYGLSYGGQFAFAGIAGERSRLSFPLTWGGERKAAAEVEQNFMNPYVTRVEVGAGLAARRNPFFKQDDTRRELWGRVERASGPLRIGATAGVHDVKFAGVDQDFRSFGGDVAFDTRIDPALPRNAVFGRVSWERDFFMSGLPVNRHQYDGRVYIGLFGQSTIVFRALREDSTGVLPPDLQSLLGGVTNLRGFDAGTAAGDTLVTGSAELRLPLTSPLDIGKFGVSLFVDTGAAYPFGARLSDQQRKTGVGAAVWVSAAVFRLSLSVAHGLGAHTRVQIGAGVGF